MHTYVCICKQNKIQRETAKIHNKKNNNNITFALNITKKIESMCINDSQLMTYVAGTIAACIHMHICICGAAHSN